MKATGRRKLIVAALWTEVCLVFPALDMLREGFAVALPTFLLALIAGALADVVSRKRIILVTQTPAVLVTSTAGQLRGIVPPSPLITVAASAIPRDGDRASKLGWREQVRRSYSAAPADREVWVDIAVRTTASLEGVLKAIIDGLEPFMPRPTSGSWPGTRPQRAPGVRSQDDLVVWLRVTRRVNRPRPIALAAGLYQEL